MNNIVYALAIVGYLFAWLIGLGLLAYIVLKNIDRLPIIKKILKQAGLDDVDLFE